MKLITDQLTNLVLFALKENRVDYLDGKRLMDDLATLKSLTADPVFMDKFAKETGRGRRGGRKAKEASAP